MNGKTINLSIRMDKDLKEQAEKTFSELGLNMTTAINVFVRQSVRQGKIPFEIALDRPETPVSEGVRNLKKPISVADFVRSSQST